MGFEVTGGRRRGGRRKGEGEREEEGEKECTDMKVS